MASGVGKRKSVTINFCEGCSVKPESCFFAVHTRFSRTPKARGSDSNVSNAGVVIGPFMYTLQTLHAVERSLDTFLAMRQ